MEGEGRKNVIFNGKLAISWKLCKTGPRSLLITKKKLHNGSQIICKSSTLDDPEGQYTPLWLNGAR